MYLGDYHTVILKSALVSRGCENLIRSEVPPGTRQTTYPNRLYLDAMLTTAPHRAAGLRAFSSFISKSPVSSSTWAASTTRIGRVGLLEWTRKLSFLAASQVAGRFNVPSDRSIVLNKPRLLDLEAFRGYSTVAEKPAEAVTTKAPEEQQSPVAADPNKTEQNKDNQSSPPPKKRVWWRHPLFLGIIAGLLAGPSIIKEIRNYLVQRTLDSPMLAAFPPSVRRPLLNALATELSPTPHTAAFWYYTALTKAIEEGVDPCAEVITMLVVRWAALETQIGNGKKALDLYERLFWKLVKGPETTEPDGTWKVEAKEARASRLDRAGLVALYAAGAIEAVDEGASEREVYEQALLWNKRVVNVFLNKNGSEAGIGPETVDNDLAWIEDLAPEVGDIAELEYTRLLEEDVRRQATELAIEAGKQPPATPADWTPAKTVKSPLMPYLRPTQNKPVLLQAMNNISEYSFVLDTALRGKPAGMTVNRAEFANINPEDLLRSLSYRLHGVLLDLEDLQDPCGLAIQLAGIMETYANTGRLGAKSAEEFGAKARDVALFSLNKKVLYPLGCVECTLSVSTILAGMWQVGSVLRTRKSETSSDIFLFDSSDNV